MVGSRAPTARMLIAIRLVFATAGDPVGNHLVDSLARPGGNVTGLSVQSNELAGKRIELLREVVPGLRHLAILGNGGNPQSISWRSARGCRPCTGLGSM